MALYPSCGKWKLHYTKHSVDSLEKFGVMLHCWSTERKHKFSKQLADFCYRNFTKTLLMHDVTDCRRKVGRPDALKPVHLSGNVRPIAELSDLFLAFFGEVSEVVSSVRLRTPHGLIARSDLIGWSEGGDGPLRLGFARLFLFVTHVGAEHSFYVVADMLQLISGAMFALNAYTPVFVPPASLKGTFPYQIQDQAVRVALPTVM